MKMKEDKGTSVQITCPRCRRTVKGYMTRITVLPKRYLKIEYHNSGLFKSLCSDSGFNFEPNQTWKDYINKVIEAGGRATDVKMPYEVESWTPHKLWRYLRNDK